MLFPTAEVASARCAGLAAQAAMRSPPATTKDLRTNRRRPGAPRYRYRNAEAQACAIRWSCVFGRLG